MKNCCKFPSWQSWGVKHEEPRSFGGVYELNLRFETCLRCGKVEVIHETFGTSWALGTFKPPKGWPAHGRITSKEDIKRAVALAKKALAKEYRK